MNDPSCVLCGNLGSLCGKYFNHKVHNGVHEVHDGVMNNLSTV